MMKSGCCIPLIVLLGLPLPCQAVQTTLPKDEEKPKAAVQKSVVTYQFILPFSLHFEIEPAIAAEMSQALSAPDAEPEIKSILLEAAKDLEQIERDGQAYLRKAGEDEGNELLRSWYEGHGFVDDRGIKVDPAVQASREELDAALAQIRERLRPEGQRIRREAESLIDITAARLAELSSLEEATALSRAKLIILRHSVLQRSERFGDFRSRIDLREFIQFVAQCDEALARVFGLEEDPSKFAQPAGCLGEILEEYNAAQLQFLTSRLARRRDTYAADGSKIPVPELARAWREAYQPHSSAVDQIEVVLAEDSAELAARWRRLFIEYLCPELTGLWAADLVITAIEEQTDQMPVEIKEAARSIASAFQFERELLVDEAFARGIAAARRFGTAEPLYKQAPEEEQRRYLESLSKLRELSKSTVEKLAILFGNDPTLQQFAELIQDTKEEVIRQGRGPFFRPHVKRFAGRR